MPDYSDSQTRVVNEIKRNLHDRYESGYPILKELLQNADDARSRRFKLDVYSGWPNAVNPLLQGSGLLVINDGTFCDADRHGILSFGESVKATDSAAIGKFGLGQKAVFHLCDAFVVHVVGVKPPFSIVVNPFLNVKVADNVTRNWDEINATDADLLVKRAGQGFQEPALILWLPFRRDGLIPAPDTGFSTLRPDSDTIVNELARTDDLRVLLTALRYLKSIEICSQGRTICSVSVRNAQERLRGPHERSCIRSFHGTIDASTYHGQQGAGGLDSPHDRDSSSKFVGREATARDACLDSLRYSDHWPKAISAVHAEPIREKGEQHGAVTLLRTGNGETQPSELRISWAVFLPVSDTEAPLPIDGFGVGRMQLLLHGYFFMDSGRRHIEGLARPAKSDEPTDPAELRRAWNTRLRDTVVLPLIPALLKDALDQGMMNTKDLAHLAAAVAKSSWFEKNRAAICKEHTLVRVLQSPERPRVAWRLVPIGAELRSLPGILTYNPELIYQLFDRIDQWAQEQGITLCIDRSASLTGKPMQWNEEELRSLFATLSPQAFQRESLARLLVMLLTELNADQRAMLAPYLVSTFRQAMIEQSQLAPYTDLKDILDYVPRDLLFALPHSVQRRAILRELASSYADILPVRSGLVDSRPQSLLAETDVRQLLIALAPMIDGNDDSLADQAATAALALLAGHDISELADRPDFRCIRILRAINPRDRSIVVLSFAELLERSRQCYLFRRSPNVESRLRTLVGALPSVEPLIVYTAVDRGAVLHDLTCPADKQVFFDLIKSATDFGAEAERAQMIELLASLDGDDDIEALRKLCAADPNADADAMLWNARTLQIDLERVIKLLVEHRSNESLVPSSIVSVLTPTKMQELQIRDLDMPGLKRLIEYSINVFPDLIPSERIALLKTDLRNDLLRCLPIHVRSDGNIASATDLFWEDEGWPIPDRLRQRVSTVILFDDPDTRFRQQEIVRRWCPRTQIEVALSQKDTHCYQEEILQAIVQLSHNNGELSLALREPLRTTRWLGTAGGAVAPKDVLNLPPSVDTAARQHFCETDGYITVSRLPERIRNHPGFHCVERLIRDQRCSVVALAQMINDSGLQGRLGSAEDYPIEQFTQLAGADLRLPGWPLLAAVLSSSIDPDDKLQVVECFHEISESESELAGQHLDALVAEVDHAAQRPSPAEAAYHHGFEAVAKWDEAARRKVFSITRVPTKSGEWRNGSQVVAEDNGVAPAYVLQDAYATMLDAVDGTNRTDEETLYDTDEEMADPREISCRQHYSFLERWRDLVPSELVAVYLRIAGRHNPLMVDYCTKWITDTTMNIEDIEHNWIRTLFFIKEIMDENVIAIALSGDRFDAPLDNISSTLIVGNLHHKKRFVLPHGDQGRTRVITFQVRILDPAVFRFEDRVCIFREFIKAAAYECLSNNAMEDVCRILDRAANVEQTTLEETERLLRDRLPALLAALKLSPESQAHAALKRYEEKELKDSNADVLKDELWQSISDPTAAPYVLDAIRARIRDQGYNRSRALFELFQNADDAYVQRRDQGPDDASFRVYLDEGGLRIVHWGRPINHRGYERDLLNMLVMSFTEKRPREGVTGKFGLGFKCVHLLSDSVGIACRFIALRTVGGILPERWPDGLHQAEAESGPTGKATVIDVRYNGDMATDGGRKTEQAFLEAMTWLPAFARRVRRIEVRGREQRTLDCSVSNLTDNDLIDVVTIQVRSQTQRALRLNLGHGYSLLLKVGAEGPQRFEPSVGRIWNLAPLEENVRSGWLLNGPFPVDPGRGRLAGEIEDWRARFKDLGQALGERLLELYDLVDSNWEAIASALALNRADSDAQRRFWCGLFDVMSQDLDDDLARRLHAADRGYGRLVAELPVVPTRLRRPFDALVSASSINRFTDKALAEVGVLETTRNWCSAKQLKNQTVASEVAAQLRKLGFGNIQSITLSDLLRIEIGTDKRVDVGLATRLGQVIRRAAIEKEPLHQERREILEATSQALFRAQDDTWRPVKDLSSKHGSDDEILRCGFAPDHALLHEEYEDDSLEFFNVARIQSGYSPSVHLLRQWVDSAADESRRHAVLRYLERGQQGPHLARSLRQHGLPNWMNDVLEAISSHRLLEAWTDEERKKFVVELAPDQLTVTLCISSRRNVSHVLEKLHEWWKTAGENERCRYATSVYPEGFDPVRLSDANDRVAWFTMFALACYQSFGRTQDEQHRDFITLGWPDGWWKELAQSEPSDGFQPWLDRLERWSAAEDRPDQTYHQWERTLVDLYAIARWLKVYVELILTLPQIVQKHGHLSLDTILRPSYSPVVQPLGLEAAPINRSLGIGVNWLIRELSRNGVYSRDEAMLMAPYCWAPSRRVRNLLRKLDPDLHLTADKDKSPDIYKFMISHLGAERALFDGDFDLPLQIVTRKRYRDLLNRWFVDAGLPEFGDESEDDEES